MKDIVISLFDCSGNWSRPWLEAGYIVYRIDVQNPIPINILNWDYQHIPKDRVYAVLAAVPSTEFAYTGSEWFPLKDRNGATKQSCKLVKKTMEIINYFNPAVWCIENPRGRIRQLNPEIGYSKAQFHPWQYAGYNNGSDHDRYPKETWLYGKFCVPYTRPYPPLEKYKKKKWKEEIISEETPIGRQELKYLRSVTPMGFSIAFYQANEQVFIGSPRSDIGRKGEVRYV